MKPTALRIALSAAILTAATLANAPGAAAETFMGPEFAKRMCQGWNDSRLPAALGAKAAGGNGWVEEANKYTGRRNVQEIVVSRRDCKGWQKVQLTIENKDGKAVCTYGGKLAVEYKKAAWSFTPKTVDWYRFATKWSAMDMPAIMTGFRGPIPVARKNLKNFGTFWKFTGKIAKSTNADYVSGCSGLKSSSRKKIEKLLKKIK